MKKCFKISVYISIAYFIISTTLFTFSMNWVLLDYSSKKWEIIYFLQWPSIPVDLVVRHLFFLNLVNKSNKSNEWDLCRSCRATEMYMVTEFLIYYVILGSIIYFLYSIIICFLIYFIRKRII